MIADNRTIRVRWLFVASSVEASATGLLLILLPSLFAQLIFGAELPEAGIALGRLAGIALLTIGLACWPNTRATDEKGMVRALLTYNVLATVFLGYLGIASDLRGILLWPAVAIHATLAALFSVKAFRR
jgi:hypothetical protein